MRRAFESGYRTYLYFIATETPEINIARIAQRVQQGGHDVPPDKTRQRYHRGLELLKSALPFLSRGYFSTIRFLPIVSLNTTGKTD